jgi:hypothetical protein
MSDAVLDILDELRAQRPAIYLADEFATWETAIGQVIASIRDRDMRWHAVLSVAGDLMLAMPGLPAAKAFQRVAEAILKQTRYIITEDAS